MTNEDKTIILKLRDEGKGYGEIAKLTGISKNSITAFIRREGDKKYDDLHSRVIKIEQKVDDHIKNEQIHTKGGNDK